VSGRAGYANVISLISITPAHVSGTNPSSLSGSISDFRSIVRNNSSADEEALVTAIECGATVVIAAAATMTANMTVKL
jgi:hypothetical protein